MSIPSLPLGSTLQVPPPIVPDVPPLPSDYDLIPPPPEELPPLPDAPPPPAPIEEPEHKESISAAKFKEDLLAQLELAASEEQFEEDLLSKNNKKEKKVKKEKQEKKEKKENRSSHSRTGTLRERSSSVRVGKSTNAGLKEEDAFRERSVSLRYATVDKEKKEKKEKKDKKDKKKEKKEKKEPLPVFCHKCGAKFIDSSALFCSMCGEKIPLEKKTKSEKKERKSVSASKGNITALTWSKTTKKLSAEDKRILRELLNEDIRRDHKSRLKSSKRYKEREESPLERAEKKAHRHREEVLEDIRTKDNRSRLRKTK